MLPLAVADLAHDAQHRVIRHVFQLANDVGEQLRALANRLEQVARDFASERQKDVGIFAKSLGKGTDLSLRRWWLNIPFNFR